MKRKIWTADGIASWALTRQRGRRHFIITRGVLLCGLPLGLCLFALHVWLVEPRDVLLAFMYVPGFLFFGWIYGDYLWRHRERAFERELKAGHEDVAERSAAHISVARAPYPGRRATPGTPMTSQAYKTTSRRIGGLCAITFFAVSIPILAAVMFADDRIARHVSFDRSWVFLLSMPFACGSFCIGAWACNLVHQRIGLRCPHCGRSLTLRCDPRKIIASGVCPDCHEKVFNAA